MNVEHSHFHYILLFPSSLPRTLTSSGLFGKICVDCAQSQKRAICVFSNLGRVGGPLGRRDIIQVIITAATISHQTSPIAQDIWDIHSACLNNRYPFYDIALSNMQVMAYKCTATLLKPGRDMASNYPLCMWTDACGDITSDIAFDITSTLVFEQ